MPPRSRQRDGPATAQLFGISVSYYIGAAAAVICIVLVILKLPNRNVRSTHDKYVQTWLLSQIYLT